MIEPPLRTLVLALALAAPAGCERPPTPDAQAPAKLEPPNPPEQPEQQNPPVRTQAADGGCDPMPKAGDACKAGDAYCVESWGEPGGRSSALWCRDGRWQREEEENLPATSG